MFINIMFTLLNTTQNQQSQKPFMIQPSINNNLMQLIILWLSMFMQNVQNDALYYFMMTINI